MSTNKQLGNGERNLSVEESTESQAEPAGAIPPVGLNWKVVSERLGIDLRVLEHDGLIVLPGQYFPEAGFAIDPDSFKLRRADVGDLALRPVYFLGEMTMSEFNLNIPVEEGFEPVAHPVIKREKGPVIGLFALETQARRARQKLIQASMAAGVSTESGPLGIELRVQKPEDPGAVATVMASFGGAVISIGGKPPTVLAGPSEATATGSGPSQDVDRPGTGVTGDSA